MKLHHFAYAVAGIVFLLTTALLFMIPLALKHEMDFTGKTTFYGVVLLSYTTVGLIVFGTREQEKAPEEPS